MNKNKNNDIFWLNNYRELFQNNNYLNIFPSNNQTQNNQLNSLTRLMIVIFIILVLLYFVIDIPVYIFYIPLFLILVIIILYYFDINLTNNNNNTESMKSIKNINKNMNKNLVNQPNYRSLTSKLVEAKEAMKFNNIDDNSIYKIDYLYSNEGIDNMDKDNINNTLDIIIDNKSNKSNNSLDSKIKDITPVAYNADDEEPIFENSLDVEIIKPEMFQDPKETFNKRAFEIKNLRPDNNPLEFAEYAFGHGPTCKQDTSKCIPYDDLLSKVNYPSFWR